MKRRTIFAGLIGCLCIGVGSNRAVAGPVLIGGSPDGIIYDVDPSTGLASNPRDTGLGQLSGLAFSSDGVLFARSTSFGAIPDSLFTLDVETGSAALVGSIGLSGGDFGFDPVTSLLYDRSPINGAFASGLYTINPLTLEVKIIANIPFQGGPVALDVLGNLYVLDLDSPSSDNLLLLDKMTGNVLSTIPTGAQTGGASGLAIAPGGAAFFTDGGPTGTGNLYIYDISTGELTDLGSTGLDQGLTSLAVIPEPSTLLLLILGAWPGGPFIAKRWVGAR